MKMMTVKEAAEKWGVTSRRVQGLCKEGKIKGVERWERTWMIPKHAVLPSSSSEKDPRIPMPRRTPFLDMTDLYSVAGEVEDSISMLENNYEAHSLLEAFIDYRRGEIDKVYEKARYFLKAHSGFYAILGAGILLALCAIWKGDVFLFNDAKRHICEAPSKTDSDREIISLTLAVVDSSVYDNKDFPDWFRHGSFEKLHRDSHPAAKVFYIKYLYMTAFALASNQVQMDNMSGLSFMRVIPYVIEPMISQAVVDGTVLPEAYLRLSCAVAYHNTGEKERAIEHVDKALALTLPDGLYGVLTEYVRHFDGLLEERMDLIDKGATEKVKELYKTYSIGWAKLSGAVRNRVIAANLTSREREVAKLAAFGYTTKDIAAMLFISESTVKQTVLRVVQKTGVKDRTEFATIL